MTSVLSKGNVAVITGASSGIGLATAKYCAKQGMKVCMADIDESGLKTAIEKVKTLAADSNDVISSITDVSVLESVQALKDTVYTKWSKVDFLFNNAGIVGGGAPTENLERWHKVLQVNLFGVIYGVQVFSKAMIDQGTEAVIVNTGSKQGITFPPGDCAYNVSKAGVKVVTEGLQHTLRTTPGCKVRALLLVPGWVNTSIALKEIRRKAGEEFDAKNVPFSEDKPHPGAWMPSQVVDMLVEAINANETNQFYVICPDAEMSNEKFNKCIQWTADDIIKRRPPLARWSEEHKEEYAQYIKDV